MVAALLAPGGHLSLRGSHPVLWSLADPRGDGLLVVEPSHVEHAGPDVRDEPGTYVSSQRELEERGCVPRGALPGMVERLPGGELRLADRP